MGPSVPDPDPPITVVSRYHLAFLVLAPMVVFPGFLIAVVPLAAVAIALLIDWDRVWARIRHPRLTGATDSR